MHSLMQQPVHACTLLLFDHSQDHVDGLAFHGAKNLRYNVANCSLQQSNVTVPSLE